jgi:UDP:flavonoid glycosyltransferase YjiC (YdhE family)
MKKILFVAEAVSLAHVTRPSMLAESISSAGYEIVFASNGNFAICSNSLECEKFHLDSISAESFLRRLAAGKPVYSEQELVAYVEADLRMLKVVRPDAVVGDFRLSMAIAARLSGVPLFSICNAYWSPFAIDQQVQAPDLPIASVIGFNIFDKLFRLAWPVASRYHCTPINRVRRRYGLSPYRSIRDYYCDGDFTMYADTPALVPTANLPSSHAYIGPIVWSPSIPLPEWWTEALKQTRPRAYITLGSTGSVQLLPTIVAACLDEGMVCLIATAGRSDFKPISAHVFAAPFLPGSDAADAANLVICNGGSPTAYQALEAGRPVLGICSNLDQVLNMKGVQRSGAGLFMRAGECTHALLRKSISALLRESSFSDNANRLQDEFNAMNAQKKFLSLLECELS